MEDFFVRFKDSLDRFDFLICKENCEYYIPKKEERKCELTEEQDVFNIK